MATGQREKYVATTRPHPTLRERDAGPSCADLGTHLFQDQVLCCEVGAVGLGVKRRPPPYEQPHNGTLPPSARDGWHRQSNKYQRLHRLISDGRRGLGLPERDWRFLASSPVSISCCWGPLVMNLAQQRNRPLNFPRLMNSGCLSRRLPFSSQQQRWLIWITGWKT